MVSVIIPTRNRCIDLAECLESVFSQSVSPSEYEVIVIDNGSTDGTRKLCDELRDIYSNMSYYYDANPGLHVGRNTGIQKSNGDVLAFLDDDVIVSPTWMKGIIFGFGTSEEIALIGGNDAPLFQGDVPDWINKLFVLDKKSNCRLLVDYSCIEFGGTNREIDPYYVFGCNFAVRKEIVLKAGGFCPDGMPKEFAKYRGSGESYISEFVKENGYEAWFFSDVSVEHKVSKERMNIEYIKGIAYRSGISYSYSKIREGKRKDIEKYLKRRFINMISKSRLDMIKKREFYKGVLFHFSSYDNSLSLQEWVHRKNYMGENMYFTNQ